MQPGPWTVAGAEISDRPRFEYRGTMLDVARHFFAVDDVLRYIDLISLYKVNVLHLHLTDDQGWRLTVPGWPRLTEVGGPSDIDGGPGGFYSPADYARIVEYAAERFIEVVPEIDGPGHASAALIAYPELSCDGVAPPPFHHGGISEVSLCASADSTYAVPRRRVRRPRRRAGPVHPHRRRRGDRHVPRRLPGVRPASRRSSSSIAAGRR